MELFDVVVIGAGPTGATAAKILAETGLKVLVVERMKLPRYKSCSGMLIKKSIDLVKRFFGKDIPDSIKCTPFNNKGMFFHSASGKEYTFEQNALNVWRNSFDYWLITQAFSSGAELRDATSAISCHNYDNYFEIVLMSDEEYRVQAKYIVDCEGATSAFKRSVDGKKPSFITTFQSFNKGTIDLDPHYFYAYLQPGLSEYDAWFNVKDGMLVLGVAVKDAKNIPFYYKNFFHYMQQHHNLIITKELKNEKWIMPYIDNTFLIDYGTDRLFFAGEVAGFLNPMGEGISAGIESGAAVAQAIINSFSDPTSALSYYISETESLKNYMKRQWNLVKAL